MKKVLIIGNGFDLAHGAETSFIDFSEYLLRTVLIPDLKNYVKKSKRTSYFKNTLLNKTNNFVFPEYDYKGSSNYNLLGIFNFEETKQYEMLNRNFEYWIGHLNNKLLLKLFLERSEYWFSVEDTFYRELKKIYENKTNLSALDKLNSDFNEIKILLKEYLKKIKIEKSNKVKKFFTSLKNGREFRNGELVIINFNYTDTIKNYSLSGQSVHSYYAIHGTLKGDVIFGYGNDKDKEYQEIKNLGEDKFLEHFKTHKYLLNSNYQDLYAELILSKNSFEVHILGHSLGLTDKTLLQEIFSSPNCSKIFLYKRNFEEREIEEVERENLIQKEFTKLTMATSRIIDDEMTRTKIVNLENSTYFP